MSQKGDTKDLANLVAANLLDHYLSSIQAQLEQVKADIDNVKLWGKSRKELQSSMDGFRIIIGRLSGDRKARRALVKRINKLRDQLDEPYEWKPYTRTCVRNVEKAIDWAISENFGLKEDVLLSAFTAVLSKFNIVQLKSMVPEKFYDMVQRMKQEEEEGM